MSRNLAYPVLTPITNGKSGMLFVMSGPCILDSALSGGGMPSTNLFGMAMRGYPEFYFCPVLLTIDFIIPLMITRSPFGMMLKAIESNQNREKYTGFNTGLYRIWAFVISGMDAGLAGGLLAATDPLTGVEWMHRSAASGVVVLMTILGVV